MSREGKDWADRIRGVTPAERLVAQQLGRWHKINEEPEETSWRPQTGIAHDLDISLRTVQRALDGLQEKGFVTVKNKGNQYNQTHYELDLDRFQPKPENEREAKPKRKPKVNMTNPESEHDNMTPSPPEVNMTNLQVNMTNPESEHDKSGSAHIKGGGEGSTTSPPELGVNLDELREGEGEVPTVTSPERTEKPSWTPPEWWEPMEILPEYKPAKYEGAVNTITEVCDARGVEPIEVVKAFTADWPMLRLPTSQGGYGKKNPVRTLLRNINLQVDKVKRARNGARASPYPRSTRVEPRRSWEDYPDQFFGD